MGTATKRGSVVHRDFRHSVTGDGCAIRALFASLREIPSSDRFTLVAIASKISCPLERGMSMSPRKLQTDIRSVHGIERGVIDTLRDQKLKTGHSRKDLHPRLLAAMQVSTMAVVKLLRFAWSFRADRSGHARWES